MMEHDLKLQSTGEALKLEDAACDVVFFNASMQRNSVFLPAYLEELLQKVASKQGDGKAKFIRNAILRELKHYIDELGERDSGPYDRLVIGNSPEQIGSDAESDAEWVKQVFLEFAKQDEKFPEPTRTKRFGS